MKRLAWVLAMAVGTPAVLGIAGCNSDDKPPAPDVTVPEDERPAGGEPGDQDDPPPAEQADAADDPPAEPAGVPEVYLSEQHLETCRLQVGDQAPEMTFTTLDGASTTLEELVGPDFQGLTILEFWQHGNPYSEVQMKDLQDEFATPYADQPVKIVSVLVAPAADPAVEQAQQAVASAGASYPVVLDPDGEAFLKFATDYVPRLYLLDADGTIVWFDIFHSRDTRRNLRQALDAKLAETSSE